MVQLELEKLYFFLIPHYNVNKIITLILYDFIFTIFS